MGAAKSWSLRVLVLPAGPAGCVMEIILPGAGPRRESRSWRA
jgi:hypothetical protein